MVIITPQPLYTPTPQKNPGTHLTAGWVGPTDGLDVVEKKNVMTSFAISVVELSTTRDSIITRN
jgi:hypothetical protein